MSFFFFNPWLLLGLISIGLPILIHLLSRKNVKVVEWGAMQFLELGKRTRRKYQLEHLLLLLLRILLICLICFALARPWLSGLTFFGGESHRDPRALLLIIDSSLSMGRNTPDAQPIERAKELALEIMDDVHPGDQFYLVAAHEVPQPLLPGWTTDPEQIRTAIRDLPAPSGSAQLPASLLFAVRQFQEVDQLQREVVLLTDDQAASWRREDEKSWRQLENLFEITPLPPRLWSLPVIGEEELAASEANSGLEPPTLSREVSVADRSIQIKTQARHWGETSVSRTVHLSIDGQRLGMQSRQLELAPGSSSALTFDYQPTTPGSHLVTIEWERDNWPGDDIVQSVLQVRPQISVMMIENNSSSDPTLSQSFYLATAFAPSGENREELLVAFEARETFPEAPSDMAETDLICLANVRALSSEQLSLLRDYVHQGGSLLLMPGDLSEAETWNRTILEPQTGLLPLQLTEIKSASGAIAAGVHVDDQSLRADWLKPFRAEEQGGLTTILFTNWWGVKLLDAESTPNKNTNAPQIAVRLDSANPWLVTAPAGDGQVALLTSPLNAAWSNLPTKPDFVPFVHELVFSLLDRRNSHNLQPGQPLVYQFIENDELNRNQLEFKLTRPDGEDVSLRPNRLDRVTYDKTYTSGVYRLEAHDSANDKTSLSEVFAVGFDPGESNPTALSRDELASMRRPFPWEERADWNLLQSDMKTSTGRIELTTWLLILFVLLLLGEQFFTHRLVRDAHQFEPLEDEEVAR